VFIVDGTKITMSKGDTGSIRFPSTGYTFSGLDRAMFSVKNSKGQIVKQEIFELEDGEFEVTFYNADTDELPAGNYTWDVRYVLSPQYDDEGHIVDGAQVITPMEPQKLVLLDVVGKI
jgi:hypothetical protein